MMKKTNYLILNLLCIILITNLTSCSANSSVKIKTLKPFNLHLIVDEINETITSTTTFEEVEETPQFELDVEQERPLSIGIIAATVSPQMIKAADDLEMMLQKEANIEVQFQFFSDEAALFKEMELFNLQFAWLTPESFIYAKQRNLVHAGLITTHYGVTKYGTQFLANIEDGYKIYYDPRSDRNTSSASIYLKQFRDKRICLVSPDSLSGSIVPLGLLKSHKIDLHDYVYLESHAAVIRGLYIDGICDFGAVFSGPGDPRTTSSLNDLPNVQQKIVVIGKSDAIIPTIALAYHSKIDPGQVKKIFDAFILMAKDTQFQKTLSSALDYEVQSLNLIEDSFYEDLEELITILEINPETLFSKD